jgi:hypothetical protein
MKRIQTDYLESFHEHFPQGVRHASRLPIAFSPELIVVLPEYLLEVGYLHVLLDLRLGEFVFTAAFS